MGERYEYEAELVRVVDGDTLDLDVDLGFYMHARIRVRLLSVDTPEVYGVKKGSDEHKRGVDASRFTTAWLSESAKPLLIHTEKTGKYGRWLAKVFDRSGQCLNDALREQGWGNDG